MTFSTVGNGLGNLKLSHTLISLFLYNKVYITNFFLLILTSS